MRDQVAQGLRALRLRSLRDLRGPLLQDAATGTDPARAVDGAPAAEYLQTIAELLARPLVLVS